MSHTSSEQRITNLLFAFWEEARGEAPMPLEETISQETLSDIWESCFMVKLDDIKKGPDYTYSFLGENIKHAHGTDIGNGDSPPLAAAAANRLSVRYGTVIATKKPAMDEGEFINAQGKLVKYRQALLPFSNDYHHISCIFGGMRYRIIE